MSESGDTTPPAANTAGALLRAARQAQGLHVAALATTLKVPPRKLEALENDRYDEFQGATFVRALAQAACRALKIDPAPVLEKLPELDNGALSQLERGLNAPFREKGARRESSEMPGMSGAVLALVVVLVLGALAFVFWPADWRLPSLSSPSAGSPSTSEMPVHVNAPVVVPATSASATEPVFPAPALPSTGIPNTTAPTAPAPVPANRPASAAASAPVLRPAASAPVGSLSAPVTSVAAGGSLLKLQARAASWVEVVDGRSQVLISRTLAAGEAVGFDAVLPLRVKIGNVSGTDVAFRGQAVDLAPLNRDNVAKLELK
jgi:cytoskeleton protein RodZ